MSTACCWRTFSSRPLAVRHVLKSVIACQISSIPRFSRALQVRTRGCHSSYLRRRICRADSYIWRAMATLVWLSPSSLLMTIRSAISIRPFLMPCKSSPPPAICSEIKQSTMPATSVSDCPTPTVSTITTSKPAASHSSINSRARWLAPPK